ncbi:MAG: hypothetical protein II054_03320, partial [Treponema sp.]|nr:hypothetical protein [Treponema sp.]
TQKKYGLYFDMEQDKEGYHIVTNVIPDSAADKAGIKVGAKIMFDAMPMIDETIFNAQYVIDKLNKPNTMRQLIMSDYSLKWDVVGVLNHEWVVIVKTENGYGFASVNGSDSISLRVVQDSNYVITRLFIR